MLFPRIYIGGEGIPPGAAKVILRDKKENTGVSAPMCRILNSVLQKGFSFSLELKKMDAGLWPMRAIDTSLLFSIYGL